MKKILENIQMIALDLDGTALTSDKDVLDSTLHALNLYREKGVKIAVATGRSLKGSAHHLAKIKPDVMVLSGGAYVKCGGTTLVNHRIPTNLVWKIINMCRDHGCEKFILCTPADTYISKDIDIPDNNFVFRSIDDEFPEEFVELSCNIPTPMLEKKILALDKSIGMTKFSIDNWRRFAHRDANKGTALKIVMNHLGINKEHVAAFGDDYNDIEMFSSVGISVAMKEAHPDVKSYAKYECGSNNEHGIANFLLAKQA